MYQQGMVKGSKGKSVPTKKKGRKESSSYSDSGVPLSPQSSSYSGQKVKSKKISKGQKTKTKKGVPLVSKPAVPSLPASPPLTTPSLAIDPPAPEAILGYTPAQLQKYKQQSQKLSKWSNQKLKDSLKNNQQSMSGNKEDLIRKVADGIVLGKIPRCTSCFGGRPFFDYKLGTYTCKGFHDDTEMVECDKVYQINEITRDPWVL